MVAFMVLSFFFFFSLVDIEDGNVFQKKKLKNLSSFFLANANADGGCNQAADRVVDRSIF
jgi:hypothetical protein